jgi:restriction system protein
MGTHLSRDQSFLQNLEGVESMGIPNYQEFMLPLLRLTSDGEEHSLRQAYDILAEEKGLTEDERKQLLPSGRQAVVNNRIGWAATYMKKAGLLVGTRRGYFRVTQMGKEALSQNPAKIDNSFLKQYESFNEFQSRSNSGNGDTRVLINVERESSGDTVATPEEALETAYQSLRDELSSELLDTVKAGSPSLFEKIVVELLVKMGYGGSIRDAGQAIGKSGDEGIDGIIKEDSLGLDIIYIQAKRWQKPVGRPEIQKFAGALQGQRARKGVMITTAEFTREAKDYVTKIENKIVLIDGERLSQLMIDHNLGVSPAAIYEVKRMDTDYFFED